MTRRPAQPKLTAQPESTVPTSSAPTTGTVSTPPPNPNGPTGTVTLRVPADLAAHVQREIRRLHFETGQSKGAIATAFLSYVLDNIGDIDQKIKANV